MKDRATFRCGLCGDSHPEQQGLHPEMLHGPTVDLMSRAHPDWARSGLLCHSCVNRFRAAYVEDVLSKEAGELNRIQQEVVESIREQELLARDTNAHFASGQKFGDRVADRLATFGGSWRFIGIFAGTLALWIGINALPLLKRPFDPYPFILLNLVLSCLAAVQAPVIMMSQNRQEAKDRLRAEEDYRINLKAELEIRHLQSKLDQLLSRQWGRLLEIQQIQVDLLEELARARKGDQA